MDPAGRMTCDELLDHSNFNDFRDWFQPELEMLLARDARKVAKSKSRINVSHVSRNLYYMCYVEKGTIILILCLSLSLRKCRI